MRWKKVISILIGAFFIYEVCSTFFELHGASIFNGGFTSRVENRVCSHYSFSNQHVVQSHELWVRRVVVLDIPEAQHSSLLDFAQHGEQRGLHPVAVQGVLSGLK